MNGLRVKNELFPETIEILLQAVVGARRFFFRRRVRDSNRTMRALVPIMAPKITANPMAGGKPRTLCGPTVMIVVAFADSVARSVTKTVTW
jgi:hypothetical protein